MIYTAKELIELGETEYSIRKKVSSGDLFVLERGIYSTKKDNYVDEVYISKKYPNAIITGLSAFYIYDLTDHIPDYFYFFLTLLYDSILFFYLLSSFFFSFLFSTLA